jgi:iron complex outermembrane receptor protein
LYGDAAMGGVMNIITDKSGKPFTNATLNYGSYNTYGLGINHGGNLGKAKYELFVNDDHTDGFRDHSNWNSVAFGGKLKFPLGSNSSISLNTTNQLLNSQDPGSLDEPSMNENRKQSLPYFREDGRDQQRYLASADFKTKVNKATDLSVGLNYQYKKKDDVRTYTQPTPIVDPFTFQPYAYYDTSLYGDTKRRQLTTNQAGLNMRILNVNTDIDAKIAGGIEVNYGAYDNRIYDVYHGFESDYLNKNIPIDTIGAEGAGYRFNTAAYLSGEFRLLDPLKLVVGLRYDLIVDDFDSQIPDTSYSENNSALSPKIAFNINTGESERYSGSIFLSYSHSFKAPTIDQRTDYMRLSDAIFFEAGPAYQMVIYQAEPFANPELKPQKSNNYEIGTYQYYKFSDKISGEINLVGYLIEVKDEIDFDLSTLNYQNLTSTSHTGMEVSIKVMSEDNWSAFTNLNYNETEFTSGEYEGNYLKGMPRVSYVLGAGYNPPKGFGGTLVFNGAGKQYLDDENLVELNGYGILSARIDYKLNFVTIYVDANNIFNSSYSTAGFYMNGQQYLYPAIGAFFRGGLNFSF